MYFTTWEAKVKNKLKLLKSPLNKVNLGSLLSDFDKLLRHLISPLMYTTLTGHAISFQVSGSKQVIVSEYLFFKFSFPP